jgi:hypothetical protein
MMRALDTASRWLPRPPFALKVSVTARFAISAP